MLLLVVLGIHCHNVFWSSVCWSTSCVFLWEIYLSFRTCKIHVCQTRISGLECVKIFVNQAKAIDFKICMHRSTKLFCIHHKQIHLSLSSVCWNLHLATLYPLSHLHQSFWITFVNNFTIDHHFVGSWSNFHIHEQKYVFINRCDYGHTAVGYCTNLIKFSSFQRIIVRWFDFSSERFSWR